MSKARLGRGLESLLPKSPQPEESTENIQYLAITNIVPNPNQPRKHFNEEQLLELAQSIREKGVIQPILVKSEGEKHIIIAGERRYRASLLAGLDQIPVIIKNFTIKEELEIALIENIQREDLNPIEEARAYHALMEKYSYTQEEIAGKIGKSRSTIANILRLLRLPKKIQDGLSQRKISEGHARTLLSIDQKYSHDMLALYAKIIEEGLSVRAVEQFALAINNGHVLEPISKNKSLSSKSMKSKTLSSELSDMEELLRKKWGTKVTIKGNEKRGSIEIQYFTYDDLNRLYEIFIQEQQ